MTHEVYRLELTERERSLLAHTLSDIARIGFAQRNDVAVRLSRELLSVAIKLRNLEPVGATGPTAAQP